MSKTKKMIVYIMCIVFFAGLAFALYPFLHGIHENHVAQAEIGRFLASANQEMIDGDLDENSPSQLAHADLYAACRAYNKKIYTSHQAGLCNAEAYVAPAIVFTDYGLDSNVAAVVTIPSLNISMPVYLGASYSNMSAGAAQLTNTSIPIGGINTNSVIAGHCGWGGANYFRYLSTIEVGEYVYITTLWGTLVYQVSDTAIISPDDTDRILIQDGKDMITLFTCHPFASHGKYRFLAYCTRVHIAPALETDVAWP